MSGAAIRSGIKVASGTVLVVGLILGFIEHWYAPDLIVSEGSVILPSWIGWSGWWLAAGAAIAYFVMDILEWRERRR